MKKAFAFLISDWQRCLMVMFAGIFLLQLVDWLAKEKNVWLPETVLAVKFTILAVFIIEIIPRLHWTLRGLLQLLSVMAVTHYVLETKGINPHLPLSAYFSSEWLDNLVQLTPYLWFALGTWVVYLVTLWWIEAKWRIYTLLVASILAIAIRDSFSTIFLWPEAAVILFCGLFMLIICHFRQLKRKDPSAYDYLSEYPGSIALPVILLVSFTVLIGSLMPEINPLLTDPYTAWRNMRGQPASFTTGKGIEVVMQTGDSSSGYSRNDQSLGGGFSYDYTPVMTVETDHRSYWRGETRSQYNGKGWEASDAEKRAAVQGVRADTALPGDPKQAGSQLKTIELKQLVTLQTDQVYPVLFGSLSILKLQDVDGSKNGMDRFLWTAANGELRFNEQSKQPYPKTYTLISEMPIVDEEGLRKVPMDTPNRNELSEYLQLPERLPERVKTLAAEITKDADNPYDKAKKIEEYLRYTYPYTNKPDLSKGRSRDFVDRFLFEIKEGYCDYYSTSMAIMLRSLGIPARWVKGYASGMLPPDQTDMMSGYDPGMIDPDAGGVYTVRNSDAHSWVEVYFSGWGWIPFEPTSGFVMPRAVPTSSEALDLSTLPALPAAEEVSMMPDTGHFVSYGIIAVVIAALLYIGLRFEWLQLLQEKLKQRRALLLKQKVIVECEKLLRICRRKGYNRMEHETMREAMQRWSKQSKWMKNDLEYVLSTFEKAKYSKAEVTEQDWQNTVKSVQHLRSQL
ncbi:transglutaminase TgpA family protein [Paenibacillus thalictri]|uniref:Cysteine protease n=1 Tax=Paenibacillus thalictri TaxID=2527873 RepID=A0A4Q9DQ28_9BACL|nr:transglutaminaseTgpA domain-containing protein [Paenibacillus thalictri]TBL75365.1 cysteine protease [Paenibacillus thalictri]